MKSLASTTCAGRLFAGLVVFCSLILLGACGSSSSSGGNPQGFSDSSLNGTYVFSSTGTDSAEGEFLAFAGALTFSGNSSATVTGNVDVIDPDEGVASTTASGTYNVNQDGTGQFSVTLPNIASFTFNFVLSSTSHGLVTEYDTFGTGSGTIDLQTALTGVSQLALPYAVSLTGTVSGTDVVASAGSITFNTSGVSTAGIQDINDNGVPVLAEALSGTITEVTVGGGTAPGTMTINDVFGGSTFDFYPIDPTHFKVVETDGSNAFLAGDFYDQTNATIPAGQVVFTMAGTNGNPVASGGYATAAANGNFTAGAEDLSESGTTFQQLPFSGTGSSGSSGDSASGRTLVALSGFEPASQWVIYPTASAGVIMLESDSAAVMLGAAYAQSASPSIAVSQGFAFNLTGSNLANSNVEVDDIVQFNTASSVSASPNMSGVIYENQGGIAAVKGTFTAVYTPDANSSTTGRGSILTSSLPTLNGGLALQYYVVDATTVLFMEGTNIGGTNDNTQAAVGSFVQQTTPTSQTAVKHPVVAIAHAANHAHASKTTRKWTSNKN
jgi:hypothetical protein